jgi:peroxiredoxin Q/BCP
MSELVVGSVAPGFELERDGGERVSLASLKGKTVVMFFYPKDSTPGCTLEARGFSAAAAQFAKAGVAVLGVSRDSVASHCRFRDKFDLTVPLLSDADLSVHRAYGVWGEKMMYGRKVEGTVRSTFVVGPDGRLTHVLRGVRVDGHVNALLAALAPGSTPLAPLAEPAAKAPAAKKPAAKKPAVKKPAAKKKSS